MKLPNDHHWAIKLFLKNSVDLNRITNDKAKSIQKPPYKYTKQQILLKFPIFSSKYSFPLQTFHHSGSYCHYTEQWLKWHI
jgi:hypothetical protein